MHTAKGNHSPAKKVKVEKQLLLTVPGMGFFPPSPSSQGLNKAQGNAAQYPTSHRSLKAILYFPPTTGQEKRKFSLLCQQSWRMRHLKAQIPFPFLQPGARSYLGCTWRVFSLSSNEASCLAYANERIALP